MGQDFNQGINKPTTRVPMYAHTVPIRATDSGGRGISFSKNEVRGLLFRGRHGSLAFFLGRYFLCHPKKNFLKKFFFPPYKHVIWLWCNWNLDRNIYLSTQQTVFPPKKRLEIFPESTVFPQIPFSRATPH